MRSPLFYLNYCVLQWFGLRLAKSVNEQGVITEWSFMRNIKPLSGWGTDYEKWIGNKK